MNGAVLWKYKAQNRNWGKITLNCLLVEKNIYFWKNMRVNGKYFTYTSSGSYFFLK